MDCRLSSCLRRTSFMKSWGTALWKTCMRRMGKILAWNLAQTAFQVKQQNTGDVKVHSLCKVSWWWDFNLLRARLYRFRERESRCSRDSSLFLHRLRSTQSHCRIHNRFRWAWRERGTVPSVIIIILIHTTWCGLHKKNKKTTCTQLQFNANANSNDNLMSVVFGAIFGFFDWSYMSMYSWSACNDNVWVKSLTKSVVPQCIKNRSL